MAFTSHSRKGDSKAPTDPIGMRWEELASAVARIVRSKRIGVPVFVRLTETIAAENDAEAPLAALLTLTRKWIPQPMARLYSIGSSSSGQSSLAVLFDDGASALLSVSRASGDRDGLDLMILGNHGAIYHDSGQGVPWSSSMRDRRAEPEDIALVERAFRAGKPITVRKRERP